MLGTQLNRSAIFAARAPGPAAGSEEMRLTGAGLLF